MLHGCHGRALGEALVGPEPVVVCACTCRQLQSVCVSDLTRQFEEVLTPAGQAEGGARGGRDSRSASSSVEMSTIASADLDRRSPCLPPACGPLPYGTPCSGCTLPPACMRRWDQEQGS